MLRRVKSPRRSGTNIYIISKETLLSFICAERPWDCLTCDQAQERDIKWVSQSVVWALPSEGLRVLPAPFCPQQFPLNLRHENTGAGAGAGANIAALSLSKVCFRSPIETWSSDIEGNGLLNISLRKKFLYFYLTAFKNLQQTPKIHQRSMLNL
mgnify:CR=1 FL=1